MIIYSRSSDGHHAKNELWNLFAGRYHHRSINQERRHREVNSSTLSNVFSLWLHNFTLWLLHYCWPFETQDDWNFLSLVASPQYHDDHPCMYTNSRINNVTNSCLATLHWQLPAAHARSSSGCSAVAQHATISSMRRRRTGLQPNTAIQAQP